MDHLKFGDIVLLKFPFTDGHSFKKRPALVLCDTNDGDIIVCRITSKLYNSTYDIELKKWKEFELKLPSVIRVHKIATTEKQLVESKIGKIDGATQVKVKQIIHKLPK